MVYFRALNSELISSTGISTRTFTVFPNLSSFSTFHRPLIVVVLTLLNAFLNGLNAGKFVGNSMIFFKKINVYELELTAISKAVEWRIKNVEGEAVIYTGKLSIVIALAEKFSSSAIV